MPWSKAATPRDADGRVDWVDYAKGWCIVLVVLMHATYGVEDALGRESWLHGFIAWAKPFRMPDFFLVAGLFLSRTIGAPWRDFLDRKALHFAYFFVLWTLIQGAPKFAWSGADPVDVIRGLAFAMIEPFGTLWFIYLLPIFFVVTRLLRRTRIEAVLVAAAALQMADIYTGSTVVDEFAARYMYFFAGYAFAPQIFALAEAARRNVRTTVLMLVIWGLLNWLAVRYGVAALPVFSLVLGFAGAGAVVSFSALLAEARILTALRRLGAQSITVYLAFFLPMATTRIALLKSGAIDDAGTVALIVTGCAIVAPLALRRLVAGTKFEFLFERPAWLRLRRTRCENGFAPAGRECESARGA